MSKIKDILNENLEVDIPGGCNSPRIFGINNTEAAIVALIKSIIPKRGLTNDLLKEDLYKILGYNACIAEIEQKAEESCK